MKKEWELIYTAYGQLDASMIVDFLSAHGVEATAMQESLGSTYGLTVGPLGESRIYVTADQKKAAIELLEAMERGEFELPDDQDSTSPSED
ncbi:MAG: DUF2007 domain-containing protein [Leptolinea sp.]